MHESAPFAVDCEGPDPQPPAMEHEARKNERPTAARGDPSLTHPHPTVPNLNTQF